MNKKKVIDFIEELAWQDVKYDAMISGMSDYASRCAIPNYAKIYFKLWKEMFNEDLGSSSSYNKEVNYDSKKNS